MGGHRRRVGRIAGASMGLVGAVNRLGGVVNVARVPNFEGANAFSSMSSASETTGKFFKKWPLSEIKRGSKPLGRVKHEGPLGASIVTSHDQLLLHGAMDGKWLK